MSLFCFHLHRLLVADDREENFLQCRSLNVLHFRRREHRFEFGKRTGRDDFSAMQDGDTVRQSLSFLQVLGRQQDGRAAAGKLLDGIPNFNSRFGVKPCRRFVEKMTAGVPIKLMAMSIRRFIPPEYWSARRLAASVRLNLASRLSAT